MIKDRYLNKHASLELNDHLEVFRIYKPIEEQLTPLLSINLVSTTDNRDMLESKFVRFMC